MKTAGRASGFIGARDHPDREPKDFYPTPPAATRALCAVEPFEGEIRDPSCGAGYLLAGLYDFGYRELSGADLHRYAIPEALQGYDIEFGRDFLRSRRLAANMVMNPPFKLAEKFIRHGLEMSTRKVAVLARLQLLEGEDRFKTIYSRTPPARIWVFVGRLNFRRGELAKRGDPKSTVCYAWFVWDVGVCDETRLQWLLVKERPPLAAGAEQMYLGPSDGPLFDVADGGDV